MRQASESGFPVRRSDFPPKMGGHRPSDDRTSRSRVLDFPNISGASRLRVSTWHLRFGEPSDVCLPPCQAGWAHGKEDFGAHTWLCASPVRTLPEQRCSAVAHPPERIDGLLVLRRNFHSLSKTGFSSPDTSRLGRLLQPAPSTDPLFERITSYGSRWIKRSHAKHVLFAHPCRHKDCRSASVGPAHRAQRCLLSLR